MTSRAGPTGVRALPRGAAGLASKHRPKGQVRAEINVTPLVDVVLVLLIIFMVITPMIVRGVSVDLPITSHHDRKNDDNKDLIVSINASGDVYVNADKVAIDKLTAVGPGRAAPLPRQGRSSSRPTTASATAPRAPTMEAIHRAGVEDVQIGTDEQKPATATRRGALTWRFRSAAAARRGPHGEINVTPLIDIVLVLLIIFMVMTPVMLKELVAKVPQKQTENVPQPPGENPIVVELDAHDALTLNGETRAPRGARRARGGAPAHDRQKVVFFRIDDDANYGRAVRIMDVCKGAGAAHAGHRHQGRMTTDAEPDPSKRCLRAFTFGFRQLRGGSVNFVARTSLRIEANRRIQWGLNSQIEISLIRCRPTGGVFRSPMSSPRSKEPQMKRSFPPPAREALCALVGVARLRRRLRAQPERQARRARADRIHDRAGGADAHDDHGRHARLPGGHRRRRGLPADGGPGGDDPPDGAGRRSAATSP